MSALHVSGSSSSTEAVAGPVVATTPSSRGARTTSVTTPAAATASLVFTARFVKNAKTMRVVVNADATVRDGMEFVAARLGDEAPVEWQRWLHAGYAMPPDSYLRDLNLQDETMVMVTLLRPSVALPPLATQTQLGAAETATAEPAPVDEGKAGEGDGTGEGGAVDVATTADGGDAAPAAEAEAGQQHDAAPAVGSSAGSSGETTPAADWLRATLEWLGLGRWL